MDEDQNTDEKPEKDRYKCRGCNYQASRPWGPWDPGGSSRCPNCGGFFAVQRLKSQDPDLFKESMASLVSSVKPVAFIPTGYVGYDRVLGGGLVKGSSVMLFGPAGTGKTRGAMKIIDHIATKEHPCIHASSEQSKDDLVHIGASLECSNPYVFPMGNTSDIITIVERCEEMQVRACIIDSIQEMYYEGVGGGEGSDEQIRSMMTLLVDRGKKKNIIFIIINHANKKGESVGSTKLAHGVDAVLCFERLPTVGPNGKARPGPIRRLSSVGKNRWGDDQIVAYFEMNERGLLLDKLDYSEEIDLPGGMDFDGMDFDEDEDDEPPKPSTKKVPFVPKIIS